MEQYPQNNELPANLPTPSEPAIPLPNPGEGGPVYPGNEPVVPLPNPGEGGPVYPGNEPVVPLPNPGEGGPVYPGDEPVVPLPNPGEGGPVYPGNIQLRPSCTRCAAARFLNAAYGYPAFRILVDGRQTVSLLSYASISGYIRLGAGYHTVTVAGADGYIYLQKTLPFEASSRSTVAVVNRVGGLDLIKIADACCPPSSRSSNFRVSNLAINSGPLDVLLADGRVIYADVRFKETTSFKRIAPGAYEFLFAETNQLPAPSYLDIETLDSAFIGMNPLSNTIAALYLDVRASANYTVFLLQSGRGYNAVSPMVVEDR